METKQVSFHMPVDEHREFEHHLKRMGGTKSGVIRSLLHDWLEWRRFVQAKELQKAEQAGRTVDWSTAIIAAE